MKKQLTLVNLLDAEKTNFEIIGVFLAIAGALSQIANSDLILITGALVSTTLAFIPLVDIIERNLTEKVEKKYQVLKATLFLWCILLFAIILFWYIMTKTLGGLGNGTAATLVLVFGLLVIIAYKFCIKR